MSKVNLSVEASLVLAKELAWLEGISEGFRLATETAKRRLIVQAAERAQDQPLKDSRESEM